MALVSPGVVGWSGSVVRKLSNCFLNSSTTLTLSKFSSSACFLFRGLGREL